LQAAPAAHAEEACPVSRIRDVRVLDCHAGRRPAVEEGHAGGCARCVASDVRQRFLHAAKKCQARVGRERSRDALDVERDRPADVSAESGDESFELIDAGEGVAAQRADGTSRVC
jgi:hypothetical protein